MKKLMVFIVSLVFLFFLFSLASAIRINEIELNPGGTDSGKEWIELYSEDEINLEGWKLVNGDNNIIELNVTFTGFYVINFSLQWLDNSNEKIILKDENGDIVDETILLDDSYNDDRTWQYCSNWTFADSTKGLKNVCEEGGENNEDNNENNTLNNKTKKAEIYLEADWDEDEIINGKEFKIKIKAFNLEDREHNVKVYITFEDNDTIISDRYDKENDEWRSGTYYVEGIFLGSGNKSEDIKLRIRDNYKEFYGDALLNIKIEGEDYDFDEDIEILKEEKKVDKELEQDSIQEVQETAAITGSVIKLGGKKDEIREPVESKEEKSKVLYESGNEKVKKYAIYGLNVILIIIIIFLLSNKKVLKAR